MENGERVGQVSGHVSLVRRKHGPCWYAKFRLANGRQIQRKQRHPAERTYRATTISKLERARLARASAAATATV